MPPPHSLIYKRIPTQLHYPAGLRVQVIMITYAKVYFSASNSYREALEEIYNTFIM